MFSFLIFSAKDGPEPSYDLVVSGFKIFSSETPFHMKYRNGVLPRVDIAYETWGTLNEKRDNAVLISAGLSASSHAKSHKVSILTLKVLVTTIDAQWEGMGDVGSVRYEPALLPPCPTIRVLSYSN